MLSGRTAYPPFWPHWPREVTENHPYNKAGIRTTWPSLADFHTQLKQAESPSRSAERAGGSFSPSTPVSRRTVPLQAHHGQPTSWLLSPRHSVAKTLRPGEGGGVDCPQQPGSKTRRLAIQGNRSCPWHPGCCRDLVFMAFGAGLQAPSPSSANLHLKADTGPSRDHGLQGCGHHRTRKTFPRKEKLLFCRWKC